MATQSGWRIVLCNIAILVLAASSCARRTIAPEALLAQARSQFQQGKFNQASRTADLGYKQFSHADPEWGWRFRLLCASIRLWNLQTDQAERLLGATPPFRFPPLIPGYHELQAYVLFRRREYEKAEALIKRAIREARVVSDFETEADSELILGGYISYLGRNSDANAAYMAALNLARVQNLAYQESAAYLDLGVLEIEREHFGDAALYLQQATRIARANGFTQLETSASLDLSQCYFNVGDFRNALSTLQQVLPVQQRIGLVSSLSNDYVELGRIYLALGDASKALDSFRHAMSYLRPKESPIRFSEAASDISRALLQQGSVVEAEQYNKQALGSISEQDREQFADSILNMAAIAAARGHAQESLDAYSRAAGLGAGYPSVLWKAHGGMAVQYDHLGNEEEAEKSFDTALAIIRQNRSDQLTHDYKITFLSQLIRLYQQYVAFLIEHGKTVKALEVADSSRAGVLTQDLSGTSAVGSAGAAAEALKVAKQKKAVFVFYWLAPERSYAWVIRDRAIELVGLPGQSRIEGDVKSYEYLLEEEKINPLTASSSVGERLFECLVKPLNIPPGTHVVIVPDGVLHNLNFESLPVSTPSPHYWLEDVSVSIAPSLAILGLEGEPVPKHASSLLLVGNPVLDGSHFAALPDSGRELDAIRSHFQRAAVTLITGSNATPDAYRRSHPDRFGYIHFATHADANEQSPLDSAIILSAQGSVSKLFARDVAEIKLHADLVSIAACRGAGAQALTGEGLVGFAWAFFQAGARHVVTSLWDVDDRSTADIMDNFYGQVANGKTYVEALRNAKLSFIRNGRVKPYYWAPFQLYSRTLN